MCTHTQLVSQLKYSECTQTGFGLCVLQLLICRVTPGNPYLVPGIEPHVLMTLLTVMVGVVRCILGQSHPGCLTARVHIFLSPAH